MDQKYFNERYPILDNLTMTVFPQPSTELILSYNAKSLKRAAGIAGASEIANPTKEASCFLLQNRLWVAQT